MTWETCYYAFHKHEEIDMNHDKKLLTQNEAASLLGVKPHTLSVWRCTKRYPLPFVRVGRCVRYKFTDIENFISKNRTQINNLEVGKTNE